MEKILSKSNLSFKIMMLAIVISLAFILISCGSKNTTNTSSSSTTKINNPYLQKLADQKNAVPVSAEIKDGKQEINMKIFSDRYEPSVIKLKKGIPAKFNIKSIDNFGCGRTLVIPGLKIYKELPENGDVVIDAMPETAGESTMTCSMGMYSGKVIVEE